MSKKKQLKKSILTWLDEQANNGNELCIVWEGGGDSGWCHFEIDNDSVDNEYTEALVGYMYEHLNYGSWAGEFTANGRAIYNPETKAFEGTDYYGEDSHAQIEANFEIRIPKDYWFDTFHVEVECYHEEPCSVAISFSVKNGFLTDKHSDFCSNLQKKLKEYFDNLFSSQDLADNYEFRGCTDTWVFEKSEATEENDMLVFGIRVVEIQTTDSSDRDIVLEITEEMAEDINDSLK